jgi:hypothetical protein
MESNSDAVPFNDPSLISMVHFLRTNKDCARLRVRQRWFAAKKDAERKDKSAMAVGHEEDAGEDEGDDEEDGETGSIPMDLLEHVKKSVKEFQASMSTAGMHSLLLSSVSPSLLSSPLLSSPLL